MTRKLFPLVFILCAAAGPVQSQASKAASAPEVAIELRSPWIQTGSKTIHDPQINGRNCVSLVTLDQTCASAHTLAYGDRFGDNWDIFQVSSRSDRTRMIDLGAHTWDEKLEVPIIEPWPVLLPGEKRIITVNTSGANGRPGADGTSGRDADGTPGVPVQSSQPPLAPRQGYAGRPVAEQVSSVVVSGKVNRATQYTPFLETRKGHIYLVHIVDDKWDYYLLIRADDVIKGQKAALSFRRLPVSLGPIEPQ